MTNTNTIGWNMEYSYTSLPERFFAHTLPTAVQEPELVIFNHALAEQLGFTSDRLQEIGAAVLSGNELPPHAIPLAQAYAGHQFGQFTRLGDGRAILLGEQISPKGKRFDVQLKGAGRTPYSRGGDGRAALGPMLREDIISEAMHALQVPTTRSLAVVTTGETILREKELPGAVLARIAASHLRVGTFQYAAMWGTREELQKLADYAIQRHYPEAVEADNRYVALLKEVVERQASLIATWQLIGFIHGVVNTDNMTISGETIDYGPCAFMNTYDPKTVFSSIDTFGRYSYGNQPVIGGWNLARFAETLLPLFHTDKEKAIQIAETIISSYDDRFYSYWIDGMRLKLGLLSEMPEDEKLIIDLLSMMQAHQVDFTNTFFALTYDKWEKCSLYEQRDFKQWHQHWIKRRSAQRASAKDVQQAMKKNNPVVIPRNHFVEEALAAVEDGDYLVLKKLLRILSMPYTHTLEKEAYQTVPISNTPYQTFCGT